MLWGSRATLTAASPPAQTWEAPLWHGGFTGFSSLMVANTIQLSLCFLGATVAFCLSSHGLCCCRIAISHQSNLHRQGLSLLLRAGGSWDQGLRSPSAAESGGLLCSCSIEGAPTACGMWYWVCWMRGLPKGRGGKGAWKGIRERRVVGDLWAVPLGSYDSVFNCSSKTENKSMEMEEASRMEWESQREDDATDWGPER